MVSYTAQSNITLVRIYALYRLGLSSLLLVMFFFGLAPNVLGNLEPGLFFFVCGALTLLSLLTLPLLWQASFAASAERCFFLLLTDIIALVLLIHASGGLDSGLSPMLFATIATGGILLRAQASAALAAISSLLILTQTLFIIRIDVGDSRTLFTAGTLGLMLFICALGFSYLSLRLRLSMEQAATQEAHVSHLQKLAQMIIERMQTGIVVSNANGEVELINRSASSLLNWDSPTRSQRRLDDIPELEEHIRLWQTYPHSRTPNLRIGNSPTEVRVRFANLEPQPATANQQGETLIYVEDTRALHREAQQLKLASLGRLTASIAHEIRNPLGAIGHAAQLMAESEELSPADQRLTEIIKTNTSRVNQIIENVLQLSRRKSAEPVVVDLADWLPQFIDDYEDASAKPSNIDLQLENEEVRTRIDISQLTQVLTNLVDNGLRHSEKSSGEARLTLRAGTDPHSELAFLEIIDEGDGIAPENLAHIFEPFYTTEAAGSGLGLYLSRELCESNHATLNYQPDRDNKSCFRIDFAHPDRIF